MPVFDIAANTQYASPIRSYYQGKALRADTALREKQAEALQQEIDADLPERQMGIAEENLELRKAENERLSAQAETQQQQIMAELGLAAAKASVTAYQGAQGDELAKKEAGWNATLSVLDNYLPGGAQEVLEYLRQNGQEVGPENFDIEEAQAMLSAYSEAPKGVVVNDRLVNPYTGEEMANFADPTGDADDRTKLAIKLAKDFTGPSVDKWVKTGDFADLVPVEGGSDKSYTERQGRAASWLNQAMTGNQLIEDWLASGVDINWNEVIPYLESISESNSPWTKQSYRNIGLSQNEINFFDSIYAFVDPVLRQSTGAAIKDSEVSNWMNTVIPLSHDPAEKAQKAFIRKRLIAGLRIEAGPAAEAVDIIHSEDPMPNFADPTGSGQMNQLAKEQDYIPEPRSETEYKAIPVGAQYRHPNDPPDAPPRIKK